ncbi:hypothetical protein DYH09_11255 [bacterium CPR1]|nr:hypothetical protein [bacterium CPR1]
MLTAWREISMAFGSFQARWLLTLVYFSLVALSAVPAYFADRLQLRGRPGASTAWNERPPTPTDLASATRQF